VFCLDLAFGDGEPDLGELFGEPETLREPDFRLGVAFEPADDGEPDLGEPEDFRELFGEPEDVRLVVVSPAFLTRIFLKLRNFVLHSFSISVAHLVGTHLL